MIGYILRSLHNDEICKSRTDKVGLHKANSAALGAEKGEKECSCDSGEDKNDLGEGKDGSRDSGENKVDLGEGKDERVSDCRVSIVVTGDHSTPVLSGDHSFEPVPFVMCRFTRALATEAFKTSNIASEALRTCNTEGDALKSINIPSSLGTPDATPLSSSSSSSSISSSAALPSFDEIACASGALGRFPGREMMPMIKRFGTISSSELDAARNSHQNNK